MVRFLQTLVAPSWPKLLILGLIARLTAAITSRGFDHPNEVGRLLEPIAHHAGFGTALPWEWTQGILSHLPFLTFAWTAHLQDPWHATLVLRLLFATLSLSIPLCSYQLLKTFNVSLKSPIALTTLGLSLFWPELLYQSARLMDYNIESSLIALALILLLWGAQQLRGSKKITRSGSATFSMAVLVAVFSAAFLMAACFFVRPQSAVISFALFLLFLSQSWFATEPTFAKNSVNFEKKTAQATNESLQNLFLKAQIPLLFLALTAMFVLALGALESLLTDDLFFGWLRRYWTYSFTENRAVLDYGADPWHRYISDSAKYWGWTAFLALVVPCLWTSLKLFLKILKLRSAKELLVKEYFRDSAVFGLLAFPFLTLSLISHKEARYIYGYLWLLPPLGAIAWQRIFDLRIFTKRSARGITLCVLAFFTVGFIASELRVFPKWRQLADVTEEWSVVGAKVDPKTLPRPLNEAPPQPLVIPGDPDFLPGGFFLRHRGPLCYVPRPSGRDQTGCP